MFDRRFKRLIISSALFISSAACTTPVLLAPSSRPVAARAYKVLGETSAESCIVTILGIPISTDASLHTTMRKAQKSIGADALVEISVDRKSLLTGFYNQTCTLVHAKGIKFTDEQAPFVTPGPAIPALPKTITNPTAQTQPATAEPQKPSAKTEKKAAAKPAVKPKKLTRVEKRRMARLEAKKKREEAKRKRRQELLKKKQEAKRKADEKRRKAEEAKKRAEEEKKREEEAKKKAEEAKRKAEEEKRRAEESKPIPGEFAIFCKYKTGQPVVVETKSEKIEAEFVKCVHFGVRVKQSTGEVGVIPFEKIWSVRMRAPEKPTPAAPATPAKPRN